MTLKGHHLLLLLQVASGILSEEFKNHNYGDMNEWVRRAFYDHYEEEVKFNQALRIMNYFNTKKDNENPSAFQQNAVLNVAEESKLTNHNTNKSLNIQDTKPGEDNDSGSSQLSRKTDLEESPLWLGKDTNQLPYVNVPAGKVEIHVFREPNIKYTDVRGYSKYFAPWGYFVSQPSDTYYE